MACSTLIGRARRDESALAADNGEGARFEGQTPGEAVRTVYEGGCGDLVPGSQETGGYGGRSHIGVAHSHRRGALSAIAPAKICVDREMVRGEESVELPRYDSTSYRLQRL